MLSKEQLHMSSKKQLLTGPLSPSTWVSLLLTVLLFPLGLCLPGWWGWENGPIENTQVVILGAGAFLSWFAARRNRGDIRIRNLWLWVIPVWLLMAGRELSWGRAFLEPVALGPEGPVFPSIRAIWYGPYVYPFLTVIAIASLAGLWRNFSWAYIKPKLSLCVVDGALLILAAVAAQLIFERNWLPALTPYHQILEEWSELIAYWCMVSIAFTLGFQNERSQGEKQLVQSAGR
ncbi:MAG TPA: hypothetical protein PKA10_18765 [Selenomonadales bacterium]|nr:hypothetical protein [Selenomonadales bacterium]